MKGRERIGSPPNDAIMAATSPAPQGTHNECYISIREIRLLINHLYIKLVSQWRDNAVGLKPVVQDQNQFAIRTVAELVPQVVVSETPHY